MKISSIMSSELEALITELEAKKTDEKARLEALEARILKIEQDQAEREARILKLEQDQVEREAKKNRKFQTRCIQIAKEILGKKDAFVWIMESFFLRYGMTKNQKLLSQKEYKKL